jgi:flavin-binding protein dodecin
LGNNRYTARDPARTIANRQPRRSVLMSDHVYKIIELVGTSPKGTDDAIKNAIDRASKTLKNLDWFEVVETRGHLQNGKVAHYQVKLKVGFRLE